MNEKLEEAKFKLNEDKLMDNSKNEEEEKIPKEFKNIDLEFSFFISWIKSLVLSLQITSRKPLDIKYITKEDIEEKNKRIKDIKNEIIKKRLFINKMTKKNEEIVKNTQPLSFLSDNLNHLEQCQKNLEILQSSYMNLAKIKNIFPECKILREKFFNLFY